MKKRAFVLWLAVILKFGLIEFVPLILALSARVTTILFILYTSY